MSQLLFPGAAHFEERTYIIPNLCKLDPDFSTEFKIMKFMRNLHPEEQANFGHSDIS